MTHSGPTSWVRVVPAVTIAAWGGNQFSPLLALYRQTVGYSDLEVNLFFGAYILGIIPGFLLSGPLSNRYGRKAILLSGVLLGIAASILLAVGSSVAEAIVVGRLAAGASVATAMVVGTTWIKEVSVDASPSTASRRAALSITVGFGLGALVAGVLAQWGLTPTVTPYLLHVALSVFSLAPLGFAREPVRERGDHATLRQSLQIPYVGRTRFFRVVLPAASWVFAAPALAFAVAPTIVRAQISAAPVAFATLLTIVALTAGAIVQPLAPRIGRLTGGRPLAFGLVLITAGTLVLAIDAWAELPAVTVAAAAVLGAGYGICLVCGLTEVQTIADSTTLAGATAIYYCITYFGFALPAVLSAFAPHVPYMSLLGILATICLACSIVVGTAERTTRSGRMS